MLLHFKTAVSQPIHTVNIVFHDNKTQYLRCAINGMCSFGVINPQHFNPEIHWRPFAERIFETANYLDKQMIQSLKEENFSIGNPFLYGAYRAEIDSKNFIKNFHLKLQEAISQHGYGL